MEWLRKWLLEFVSEPDEIETDETDEEASLTGVPAILVRIFGWQGVDSFLWSAYALLIGIGIFLLLYVIACVFVFSSISYTFLAVLTVLGMAIGSLGAYLFDDNNKDIEPNYAAFVSILGTPYPFVVYAGHRKQFKQGGITYEPVVKVDGIKLNRVYTLRCKGVPDPDKPNEPTIGPQVTQEVSGIVYPNCHDGRKLMEYFNFGGTDEDVLGAIMDKIGDVLEHIALQYELEVYTRLKGPLTAVLLDKISDIDFRRLSFTGSPPRSFLKISARRYRSLPGVVDSARYLLPQNGEVLSPADAERRLFEAEVFISVATRDSTVGDSYSMGLNIRQLNVTEPKLVGAPATAAEKLQSEMFERQAEALDRAARRDGALELLEIADQRGEPMTLQEALRIERVNLGRSQEVTVLGDPVAGVAAGLLQKGKNND